MPGLREKVISIICEEEWPDPDNDVSSVTVYEKLKSAGEDTTESEVRQVLIQLSEHGDIKLTLEPSRGAGPVVFDVRPGLCP
jgi:Fe2+ or Zn2+ uptake regulation protein